jgi:hypothetical protein
MAPNMKAALSASLLAEDKAVRDRFDQADKILGETTQSVEMAAPAIVPVVRDTFTFPEDDYGLIAEIQDRCLRSATMINKSEIVRAGLKALSMMSDVELMEIVGGLTKVKPGRPARGK